LEAALLKDACPKGIGVYFENVGGAVLYAISFESLMEMAGYFSSAKRADTERHDRIPTFAERNLTAGEEADTLENLRFIRR
jgi:NADPH-dependent curcumin reductase CurA